MLVGAKPRLHNESNGETKRPWGESSRDGDPGESHATIEQGRAIYTLLTFNKEAKQHTEEATYDGKTALWDRWLWRHRPCPR